MDQRKNKHNDPWDEGMYGIGNTMPPKNHSGLVALLLILVIFLSGIVSVLSFLNVRLFQQLSRQQTGENKEYPLFVASSGPTDPTGQSRENSDREEAHAEVSISLHASPKSPENIPQPQGEPIQDIYARSCESVAGVLSSTTTGTMGGTAVALSEKGYLLTSSTVVQDAETITLLLPDGTSCGALVIGADPVTDLAVLFTDEASLTPAQFGESEALRVGDSVYAIGNCADTELGSTLSPGLVTGIHDNIFVSGQSVGLIRSTAALGSGFPGAPLINSYGQVIGIHTGNAAAVVPPEQAEGMSFALDSATVRDVVNQLIAQGYVSGRPTLGIRGEGVSLFDQHYFHIPPGLYIREVDTLSHAWVQGVEPGDILISINGTPISDQKQLDALIYTCKIGDALEVTLLRNSREQTMTLVLTEHTG